jgi:hypothetical protein
MLCMFGTLTLLMNPLMDFFRLCHAMPTPRGVGTGGIWGSAPVQRGEGAKPPTLEFFAAFVLDLCLHHAESSRRDVRATCRWSAKAG